MKALDYFGINIQVSILNERIREARAGFKSHLKVEYQRKGLYKIYPYEIEKGDNLK